MILQIQKTTSCISIEYFKYVALLRNFTNIKITTKYCLFLLTAKISVTRASYILKCHGSPTLLKTALALRNDQLSLPYVKTCKIIASTMRIFIGKVASLLLVLFSLMITLFRRNTRLWISWLQSTSTEISEPRKTRSFLPPPIFHLYAPRSHGSSPVVMILIF